MDHELLEALKARGLSTQTITLRPTGDPEHSVLAVEGADGLQVRLKPLRELFEGTRVPPPFTPAPPEEYFPFFHTLEGTAAVFCLTRGQPECDQEFQRVFRQLRRKPDGTDRNPLFRVLRSAAQSFLAIHAISEAEFDAVLGRLEQSAKSFGSFDGSTHYFDKVLLPMSRQR